MRRAARLWFAWLWLVALGACQDEATSPSQEAPAPPTPPITAPQREGWSPARRFYWEALLFPPLAERDQPVSMRLSAYTNQHKQEFVPIEEVQFLGVYDPALERHPWEPAMVETTPFVVLADGLSFSSSGLWILHMRVKTPRGEEEVWVGETCCVGNVSGGGGGQ